MIIQDNIGILLIKNTWIDVRIRVRKVIETTYEYIGTYACEIDRAHLDEESWYEE